MSNSGSSSLRPAWKGGRGFQPPPTVTSDTRGRSSSISSKDNASNKFSALSDDDDFQVVDNRKNKSRDRHHSSSSHHHHHHSSSNSHHDNQNNGDPKVNSRGEAFRSSFGGGGGGERGGRSSKPGRSLADLAARVPEGMARAQSTGSGYPASGGSGPGGGGPRGERRYSGLAAGGGAGGSGDPAEDAARASSSAVASRSNEPSAYKQAVDAAKVIRYTREKLLALRPRQVVKEGEFPPAHLKHIDATVLLSEAPQDPVCWDTLDADEIWATVPTRRSSMPMPKGGIVRGTSDAAGGSGPPPETGERRRSYVAPSSGRWQRGQALPPAEERERRAKDKDANSPEDLWDDPVGGATGAAMDFSAFGGTPEEGKARSGSVGSGDAFDFEKMAEASRKFEEELHGSKGSNDLDEDDPAQQRIVDPKRPLAAAGTTIRSGSGDNVNVFEDFDDPAAEGVTEGGNLEQPATTEPPKIKGAEEDPSASSRLMAMIGVKKDGEPGSAEPWNGGAPSDDAAAILGLGGAAGGISLNPWGDPIIPAGNAQQNVAGGLGLDFTNRLESFAAEQKAREAAEMEQKELLRRRQEQEEQQRRAMAQQQQAQQDRSRQQTQQPGVPQQQPQANPQQSQVELVLMERITTILENSWGRSDLVSILSTLHAEDSRVIPLLSNVDLLRDLIAHNPRRVALRQDPAFGTEMAVLQLTNQQYQQHEAQVRQQQEELRRREEQQRLENIQRQRSMSNDGPPRINPDAPWFYSDPQGNIQGPFRGDEMRQWLEAGYFKGDLPISQQAGGPFIALSAIFPDVGVAFRVQENDQEQARAEEERMMEERRVDEQRRMEQQRHDQLRQEEERRVAEDQQRMAQEQARKEHHAREAAERERQQREASEAAAALAASAEADADNAANQSSAQLKMMLGLASGEQNQPTEEPAPQPAQTQAPKEAKSNNQKSVPAPPPAPPAKPATPAWGGAASATTSTRKSMSEIQKEEARRAASLAAQQGTQPGRQSSSGWANVAATAGKAWAPGAVKPTSAAAVVAGGPNPAAGRGMGAQAAAARPKAAGAAAPSAGLRKTSSQQQRGSNTSTSAEEFGASMAPALQQWCKDQMMKINGTDDLTLVSFCMTLNDAAEIRQYLTAYLGATPQVNNFATEFINKKGGGTASQEEWETPGSAKKGRKKKGAAAQR